jgi:hypothetical protein
MSRSFKNSIRIIGWLFALASLVLLQACSAIKLAYNSSPELGYWWLDGYVDFQSEQSAKVRDELARLLQWHRTNELPKIADLLKNAQKLASADLTAPQACAVFADSRERFNAVITQVEPAAVALVMSLKPEQISHIETKLNKGNEEWRKDWLRLSAPERLEKRLESNLERAEEFYGKLEDRQVDTLRGALEASAFDSVLSFTERQRRQQDLLQTLKANSIKANPADVLTALRAWQDRSMHSPNLAYRAYSEKLTLESCASFALLHNSTTPEQRKRAAGRLGAYERDARELGSQR